MKNILLILGLSICSTAYIQSQTTVNEEIFDYTASIEVKKKEKLNDSPYSMFGDNTTVLKTDHERNLDHSLKIPLTENDKYVGLFELNFQTSIATITDTDGKLIVELKMSLDDVARFLTIDPHSEKYYSVSPYVYVNNNPLRFIDPTGMDWYEHNNGNVMWINEKDEKMKQMVDGWKHLGTEYQGITITVFKPDDYPTDQKHGGHFSQLNIQIGYKDPSTGKQSNYNWVQTVERDDMGKFIDPKRDNGNRPFYQDKDWNKQSQNVNGYDVVFSDAPDERTPNGYFNAELSLMGNTPDAIQYRNKSYAPNSGVQGQKIYNPIITLNYGFSVKNGNMSASPIRVVQPSPFQMKAIRTIP